MWLLFGPQGQLRRLHGLLRYGPDVGELRPIPARPTERDRLPNLLQSALFQKETKKQTLIETVLKSYYKFI